MTINGSGDGENDAVFEARFLCRVDGDVYGSGGDLILVSGFAAIVVGRV